MQEVLSSVWTYVTTAIPILELAIILENQSSHADNDDLKSCAVHTSKSGRPGVAIQVWSSRGGHPGSREKASLPIQPKLTL